MSHAPKTLADLAIKLGVDESRAKSILFHVVDFLCETVPNQAFDAGLYHMPNNVGSNLIEAYREMVHTSYQVAVGEAVDSKTWVSIGAEGITLRKTRTSSQ